MVNEKDRQKGIQRDKRHSISIHIIFRLRLFSTISLVTQFTKLQKINFISASMSAIITQSASKEAHE